MMTSLWRYSNFMTHLILFSLNLVNFHFPIFSIFEIFFMFKLFPNWNVHNKTSYSATYDRNTQSCSQSGQLVKSLFTSGFTENYNSLLFPEPLRPVSPGILTKHQCDNQQHKWLQMQWRQEQLAYREDCGHRMYREYWWHLPKQAKIHYESLVWFIFRLPWWMNNQWWRGHQRHHQWWVRQMVGLA